MWKIGLYALAGYGAYCAYDRFIAGTPKITGNGNGNGNGNGTLSFVGTPWQRKGYQGTYWQNQNNNFGGSGYKKFTGTEWQRAGHLNATNWQDKGVLNACGACG